MDYRPPGSSVHGILQARILSGLPFHSPGDLLDPGIEPGSPALQVDSLLSEPPGITDINTVNSSSCSSLYEYKFRENQIFNSCYQNSQV